MEVKTAKPDPDCPYCNAVQRTIEHYRALDRARHVKFMRMARELDEIKRRLGK